MLQPPPRMWSLPSETWAASASIRVTRIRGASIGITYGFTVDSVKVSVFA